MLIDLNDPKSILAWWKVFPERHYAMLDYWIERRPEFAANVLAVRAQIAASSNLAAHRAEAGAGLRDAMHVRAEADRFGQVSA